MKVQLIVVQGKPEGKQIPLVGPRFKIGRGETCHLRPNSELVSREHAEFIISDTEVSVRDLGSRNGTLVNGKALTDKFSLKNGDLVQVGPLTFAVSIQGAPGEPVTAGAAGRGGANGGKPASLDEPGHDEIESWLISDNANPTPDRPSGIYGGDTLTMKAFKEASGQKPAPAPPPAEPAAVEEGDEQYERLPEGEGDLEEGVDPDKETAEAASIDDMPEDMIDESNPFYVKKKVAEPAKPSYKDSSDAATDILRKMMERRRGSKT